MSNLLTRVLSGAVLIALVLLCLLVGGALLAALVAVAAALGAWEMRGLLVRLQAPAPLWLIAPFAVWLAIRPVLPPWFTDLGVGLAAVVVLGLIGCLLLRVPWAGWIAATAGALYLGLGLGFLLGLADWAPATAGARTGLETIAVAVASVVVCDSGAYFVGTAIGRHRFFPSISPKKSVEGAIAGVVFPVILCGFLGTLLLGLQLWQSVILGLIIGVAAEAGDLVESALKRQAGVKDSSGLIPGHGGLLDRLDSLLLVGPVVYCYLRLIALP